MRVGNGGGGTVTGGVVLVGDGSRVTAILGQGGGGRQGHKGQEHNEEHVHSKLALGQLLSFVALA